MRQFVIALLLAQFAAPALAQNDFELPKVTRPTVPEQGAQGAVSDFQQVLSGKVLPESLALKDLGGDWKRVVVRTTDRAAGGTGDMTSRILQAAMLPITGGPRGREDAVSAALGISMLGGLFGGDGEPVYYTKGQTVMVSGEVFLVAYSPDPMAGRLVAMVIQARAAGKDPDITQLASAARLTPDSRLSLSLINSRSIASLGKIRPFSMDAEIADSARPGAALMEWFVSRSSTAQQVPPPAQTASKPAPPPTKPARRPKPR